MRLNKNIFSLDYQRIRGYFYNEMRYINLHFTYLLTYFKMLTDCELRTIAGSLF